MLLPDISWPIGTRNILGDNQISLPPRLMSDPGKDESSPRKVDSCPTRTIFPEDMRVTIGLGVEVGLHRKSDRPEILPVRCDIADFQRSHQDVGQ